MERVCPVCGNTEGKPLFSAEPTFVGNFSVDKFALNECKDCNLIFLGQRLTDDDFKLLYEDSLQFDDSLYRDESNVLACKNYYGSAYRKIAGMLNLNPVDIKLLEIGSGRAWMCMVASEIGKSLAIAQDVTSECSAECTWVDEYIVGDITDLKISDHSPFHLISLTHVIEHLPSPLDSLAVLKTYLSKDGKLFITAPHRPPGYNSPDDKESWYTWSYHHVPAHLQYFSRESMIKLASKLDLSLTEWSLGEDGQSFEAILSNN